MRDLVIFLPLLLTLTVGGLVMYLVIRKLRQK